MNRAPSDFWHSTPFFFPPPNQPAFPSAILFRSFQRSFALTNSLPLSLCFFVFPPRWVFFLLCRSTPKMSSFPFLVHPYCLEPLVASSRSFFSSPPTPFLSSPDLSPTASFSEGLLHPFLRSSTVSFLTPPPFLSPDGARATANREL